MQKNIDLSEVKLYTARLILRPHVISDLYDFYDYAKEPGVGELAGWKHHTNTSETKRVIDMFNSSKRVLAIALRESNKVIGSISLDRDYYELEGYEDLIGSSMGFIIGKKYWNQGYMSEALREMMRYVFLNLELDYIATARYEDNDRTKKIFDKLGFKFIKNFTRDTSFRRNIPCLLYTAKRSDYVKTVERIKLYGPDLLDSNLWIYRGAPIPKNYYVGVVDIIIKNTKYNKYLVTRRSKTKDKHPGKLETTGGVIGYGESEEHAAYREVAEETGIKNISLSFLYKTTIGNFVYYEYFAKTSCELDSIVLQAGETEGYAWFDLEDYLNIWKTDLVAERPKIRLARALEGLK